MFSSSKEEEKNVRQKLEKKRVERNSDSTSPEGKLHLKIFDTSLITRNKP